MSTDRIESNRPDDKTYWQIIADREDAAFTAGALAMKEAALGVLDKYEREHHDLYQRSQIAVCAGAIAAEFINAAVDIRALPVPPRGSKI